MPPVVTPSGPGIGDGWTRLIEAIRQQIPVEQVDGIWVFKVIRHNALARQFTIRTEEGKEIDLVPDQVIRGPAPKEAHKGEPSPGKPQQDQRASGGKAQKKRSPKRGPGKGAPEKRSGQTSPPEDNTSTGNNA